MKSIGTILKEQRQKRDYTMTELANKIGTSQSAISVIENDKRFPTEETVYKIGKALDMDHNDLKELVELRNSISRNTPNPYMVNQSYHSEELNFEYNEENEDVNSLNRYNQDEKNKLTDFFSINVYDDLYSKIFIKTDMSDKEISDPIKEILGESIKTAIVDILKNNETILKQDINKKISDYIEELNSLVRKA